MCDLLSPVILAQGLYRATAHEFRQPHLAYGFLEIYISFSLP